MVRALLPPIPPGVEPLRPVIVGAAARLRFGGTPLHQPPELWIAADAATVRRASRDLRPSPTLPGHLEGNGWLVRPVPDGLDEALKARAVPLDALGVRLDGALIDPLGGLADLRNGVIRLPDGAAALEREPALLIQLPALASELALRLDDGLIALLGEHAGLVLRADRDLLREALTRLLVGRRPMGALQVLATSGLLALVLPEVASLIDFHKSSRHHHKDVWHHTRLVVRQAVPRPTVRWAALLHDIGKAHTRSYAPGNKVHFFRHDELGAYLFEGIAARLRFPPDMAEQIRLLIFHHLRANLYDPSWSDAAVRRFAQEIGPVLDELLLLSRADVTSRRPGRRRQAMYNLHGLQTRIEQIQRADAERRSLVPKGLGVEIIRQLGVDPGPRVGELRRACEQAVREGSLPPEPDIEGCIRFLRRHLAA